MSPGGSLSFLFAKLVKMSCAHAKSALDVSCASQDPLIQRCPIQSRLQSVLGVRPLNVERNNSKVSLFTLHIEALCFFLCAVAVENNSCLKLHSKLVKGLVRHFLHSFSFTVNEDNNENDDDEGDACDYE